MRVNDDIMKAQEAAALLGVHIETIRRMARRSDIPAFKVGKDWRFRRTALFKWIEQTSNTHRLPHLLVVDDDRAIAKSIRRILEPLGHILSIAEDGIRGLERFLSNPVDLVLLDLNMPAMNGVEFLRHLRGIDANLPIIVITGYPNSEMMFEAMQYGPMLLLPKPFGKDQLIATVETVIRPSSKFHWFSGAERGILATAKGETL